MNWYSIFYWLTVADNVKTVTGILSIVFGIYFIGASAAAIGLFDDSFSTWNRGPRRLYYLFSTFFVINLLLWTSLPTKRDSLVIVAGGAIGSFVTTDSSAKKIPHEALELVRAKLKEWQQPNSSEITAEVDTLANKSKEELIEIIKKK